MVDEDVMKHNPNCGVCEKPVGKMWAHDNDEDITYCEACWQSWLVQRKYLQQQPIEEARR